MNGGPKFVSCSVCGRPILEHSLTFHESKCAEIRDMENQQTSSQRPLSNGIQLDGLLLTQKKPVDQKKTVSSKGPLKPAQKATSGEPIIKEHRSRQTSSQSLLTPIVSSDGPRPGTMTLRGRSTSADALISDLSAPRGLAGMRVCYVCGQRFGQNSLPVHEKKCLHFWHCLVGKLPSFIKCHEPKKLAFQSVDGTVDYERIDLAALQTSMKAQRADCQRCSKSIQLASAKEHSSSCKPKPKNATKKKNPFGNDFYVTFM